MVGVLQRWYQSRCPAIQFHSSAANATVLGPQGFIGILRNGVTHLRWDSGNGCIIRVATRYGDDTSARLPLGAFIQMSLWAIAANGSELRSESMVDKLS
ncbi:hypothetical protein TIFTF001_043011 [Ficus carica]|uniref:Uncharacterized protein n=1 Tax=Ficus carica TaxID=3494 RepID=A0AA87YQF2_FICCA|nr:hypothetical protein TIFTF001_043011 [Ficus carica]